MFLVIKLEAKRKFGGPTLQSASIQRTGIMNAYHLGAHSANNGSKGQPLEKVISKACEENDWQGGGDLVKIVQQYGSLLVFEAERTRHFLETIHEIGPSVNSANLYREHHGHSEKAYEGIDEHLLNFVRGFEKASGVKVRI